MIRQIRIFKLLLTCTLIFLNFLKNKLPYRVEIGFSVNVIVFFLYILILPKLYFILLYNLSFELVIARYSEPSINSKLLIIKKMFVFMFIILLTILIIFRGVFFFIDDFVYFIVLKLFEYI